MVDEYIRKQDVVDEINTNADDLEQNGGIPFAQGARAMAIVVEQMPPADVAPVVRCKDCKFYTSMRPDIKTGICDLNVHHMGDDGFCSCGERREG